MIVLILTKDIMPAQLDLFAHVAGAYGAAPAGVLTNDELYREVARRAGISEADLEKKVPIGKAGTRRSTTKRTIRWFQQNLRAMNVIEKVSDERGVWRLTEAAGRNLHRAKAGVKVVAFSTNLGVALWASNADVFPDLGEPIHLALSSPPYPLRSGRAYGNVTEAEYSDFICRALEPIVKNLAPGGSIVLNVSNDIFMPGSPARSLYKERMVIALTDRLGLHLMDQMVWANSSKAPGPLQWASKHRMQLNVGWEPVYWFALDPLKVNADNRRVYQPHTERHMALIAQGGEKRDAVYCDGAYRISPGSFGNPTPGRIPRNVFSRGHNCADSAAHRRHAKELGFPVHGAGFPMWLPSFFIEFMTDVGQLVVDMFSGTFQTGLAAERLGRRWVGTEHMLEYIRPSAERFRDRPGFDMTAGFETLRGSFR